MENGRKARWAALAGAACATALLAGCGSGGSDTSGSASSGSSGAATAAKVVSKPPQSQLVRPGLLSICTETGTPPAAFYDDDNQLSGYLPALGDAVAARMGLKPSWVDSVFDTIIVAANTGKCDMVIADQFITPEREKQIRMIPYARIGQQLMTTASHAKDFGDPSSDPTGLCGHKVAVLSGAAELATLKRWSGTCTGAGKSAIQVITFSNTPAGLQALQGGQADLFFTDSPISGYYAKQHPDQFATVGQPVEDVQAGISVPKSKTALQRSLQAVLRSMKSDGSYQGIFGKWGQNAMVISDPGQA